MSTRWNRAASLRSELGIAFVVSLIVMLIVGLLGAGLAFSTRGARSVGVSLKNQESAFEVAVAGLERGREEVRRLIFTENPEPPRFNTQLVAAANGNALVDPSSRANFNGTTGATNATSPANAPLVASTNLDGSFYQVFLNNAGADAATSTDDTDARIRLTSFANGANSVGLSVVQAEYAIDLSGPIPELPAQLTMPGPNVRMSAMDSSQGSITGDTGWPNCYPAIAVSTDAAEAEIENAIPSNRYGNYTTCDPVSGSNPDLTALGAVENFWKENEASGTVAGPNPYDGTTDNDPILVAPTVDWTRVDTITNLANQYAAVADFTSTSDPGFSYGNPLAPKIVVLNGDVSINPSDCYDVPGVPNGSCGGVLVVHGKLTISGQVSYTGTIFSLGTGWLNRSGGGQGSFCGGVLVARMEAGLSSDIPNRAGTIVDSNGVTRVGTPRYEHSGGGGTFQAPTSLACDRAWNSNLARFGRPMVRLSFQQLR